MGGVSLPARGGRKSFPRPGSTCVQSPPPSVVPLLVASVLVVLLGPLAVDAIQLSGARTAFARYPPWAGCSNATFSFDFRTTQQITSKNVTLWYVDDGGFTDFFCLMLVDSRRVRLVLQLADTRDGNVDLVLGEHVNDGRWHSVEVRRRRAETFLTVDGQTDSGVVYGDAFHFGRGNNSYVYIGGLPAEYTAASGRIRELAMPSVIFVDHFAGTVRNVIYGNCTCERRRAAPVGGVGVTQAGTADDVCEVRNPCRDGCLCKSTESDPSCDCSDLSCVTGISTHYELPMDDVLSGSRISNPSGLDARTVGQAPFVSGPRYRGILVNGRDGYIRVSGPGHRQECLGDLDRCQSGYTLGLWVNFTHVANRQPYVYMSNGGHSSDAHGIAMTYDGGNLEFRFRRKNGQEWLVNTDNVLPGRWYHVTASWSQKDGLSLYINGELVDTNFSPQMAHPSGDGVRNNEFLIGKPNDRATINERHPMAVDEFNFWSEYMNASDVKEIGPFYRYYMSMEARIGNEIEDTNMDPLVVGGAPSTGHGKIGNALRFDGRQRDFIDLGSRNTGCLGNLTICRHGLTIAMWIQFTDLQSNTYFLNTGVEGLKLYFKDGKLTAEAQQGARNWMASWDRPELNQWYFIELSWDETGGLKAYSDLKMVASDSRPRMLEVDAGADSRMFIGKANAAMRDEKFASASIDDLEFWYGERSKLIELDFIQRGRPTKHSIAMDATADGFIFHPYLRIPMFGRPTIIQNGKIAGALALSGNGEYVSVGRQHDTCLGNLDLCRHGLLLSSWFRPGQLRDGMEYVSTGANGIRVRYAGGKFHVMARTSMREWNLETNQIRPDRWQFVEYDWSDETGLALYVNNMLVARASRPTIRTGGGAGSSTPDQEQFYFGRGDGTQSNSRYGNMTIDDVEYWYGNRDDLLAFDYIQRGRPTMYLINMDNMSGDRLPHPQLSIRLHGNPVPVPGKIGNAIRLDGNEQYIDVGDHGKYCLGNLERCNHGLTQSMWLNFRDFQNNMYYMSSGGGIRVYHRDGKLYVSATAGGKQWEVSVPNLRKDSWYFVEYTWHPEKGLNLYINNNLVASDYQGSSVSAGGAAAAGGKVLIGNANPSDAGTQMHYSANGLFDEVETWYRDRDNLIAFEYILRGDVPHISFPFEVKRGNTIVHPDFNVITHNEVNLVPGKIGNGASLEGSGEFITIGDQSGVCMGNLEHCHHGLTISFYVNPRRLVKDGYILSSGPYSVYSKDGKVFAKFSTSTKTWEVSTDRISINNWQKVELSWDESKGLSMFVDKLKVASSPTPTVHPPLRITDNVLYIGRPNEDNLHGRYADVIIDELEYWYADRERLIALGLLEDDIHRVILDMEQINGDVLVHDKYVIYVVKDARTTSAVNGNGVYLNGRDQYIEMVGSDAACAGNLQNCPKGFTLRFKMKPDQLLDNTYFVSSPLVDVFYQNGRLVAEVRTPGNIWRTSTTTLQQNAWYQVDVSWHPVDGLALYVNGQRLDQQTTGVINRDDYDDGGAFFIGRSLTDMSRRHYAHATFDDVQMWEAKRDYLVSVGLIDPEIDNNAVQRVTVRPTTSPRTTTRRQGEVVPTLSPTDGNKWFVFDGQSWIVYDFSRLSDSYHRHNTHEEFHVRFKTDEPEGLLWYNGNDTHNIHMTIKNGIIHLISTSQSGTDRFIERYSFDTGRLDDDSFHDVRIVRDGRQIKLIIDGKEFVKQTNNEISLIYPQMVYLGGSNNTYRLTNKHVIQNFHGTVSKAVLTGNTLPSELDLLRLYQIRPRPNYIDVGGQVVLVDPREPQPVTFTTGRAFVRLPTWNAKRTGSLEFHFKTVEPDGLILFNGNPQSKDSVSVEVYDGQLYVNVDFGSGIRKYILDAKSGRVDDGQEHQVRIKIDDVDRVIRMTLDDLEREERITDTDGSLDLSSTFFLGAVDNVQSLPWHVWSRSGEFFRGCVWGLRFNDGTVVELDDYVRRDPSAAQTGIEVGCKTMPTDCRIRPCRNDGICSQRTDGHVCDCSRIPYTGANCERAAPIISFNGNTYTRINVSPTLNTHVNDISLRFKTFTPDGLLFVTSNRANDRYLKVSLENGQGTLETNIHGQRVPEQLYFQCPQPLNDGKWHTLYIKRRANVLEAYVDDCTHETGELTGEGYTLDIDRVFVARTDDEFNPTRNPFIGLMQNFNFDHYRFFDQFVGGADQIPGLIIDNSGNITLNETRQIIHSVTFRGLHSESYASVSTLRLLGDNLVSLMLRAGEPSTADGLVVYNAGSGADFFAVELVDGGKLRVVANDGSGATSIVSSAGSLADGRWHSIDIVQSGPRTFTVRVDDRYVDVLNLPVTRNTLDLTGSLFIGGISPTELARLSKDVRSRQGFSGCLASILINGRLYDLLNDAGYISTSVTTGCTDSALFCSPGVCQHFGICHEDVNTFRCDCNMTSFVGPTCTDEAEGYWYSSEGGQGITIYSLRPSQSTSVDKIAFGFMTWHDNGTLLRIDGDGGLGHFIDAQLVKGHLVFTYNVGNGVQRVVETGRLFNDGNYHYVQFVRNGASATLRVDDHLYKETQATGASGKTFQNMQLIKIGGDLDAENNIVNFFSGIIAGVYINGYRVVDMAIDGQTGVIRRGDYKIATHNFFLPKVVPTIQPPVPTKDTGTGAEDGGGGGIIISGGGGGAGTGGGGPGIGDPDFAAVVGGGASPAADASTRAAAVAGAMLGVLAAVSSIAWAFYKFKPGLIGGASGAGGAGASNISPPNQATPLLASNGPAGAGVGNGDGGAPPAATANVGSGMATTSFMQSSGGSVDLAHYFSPMTPSSAAGAGGPTAPPMSRTGTIARGIQTDFVDGSAAGGYLGSSGANMQSMTMSKTYEEVTTARGGGTGLESGTQTMGPTYFATGAAGTGGGTMTSASYSYESRHLLDNTRAASQQNVYGTDTVDARYLQQQQQILQQQQQLLEQQQQQLLLQQQQQQQYLAATRTMARSPTPVDTLAVGGTASYQMHNMAIGSYYQQQQQQQQFVGGSQQLAVGGAATAAAVTTPNLMAAEEIRVDCVKMTTNGRYVVTGSSRGPPQVWDLKNGNLIRVMAGEEFSSTDLHLANGDTLLVGQVAELEQVDPSDVNAASRLHHRKLQIWDFESGRPLEMRKNELCTASCMMNNGEHLILGRTDRFGGSTTVVVWDVLGNEPIRQLRHNACLGFADHISYLRLSPDDRFAIAGVQNSYDNAANFVVFDLAASQEAPKVIALDARADVTVIVDNHEAITGTRSGDLTIWSLRTGKPLRRLSSTAAGASAHGGEVTDVALSKDRQMLVSTSTDGTVRVWNLESEKLVRTLRGHTDEVWCCTISNDGELIATGSRDRSIRLWRAQDGAQVAAINAGVDVFRVLLSNNKKTIVALADKTGARKLIMLQIVRTKTKSSAGSRATSPLTMTSSPMTPDYLRQL